MSIQEAYKKLLFQLYELYDNREAANIADMVIEHISGQKKIDRIIHKNIPLNFQQQEKLEIFTQQLLQFMPVQYVLNEAWFAGMKFFVNESVLIPRPETEELIDWINQEIKNNQYHLQSVLDIGTGSGCIPISIKKKNKNISVSSIDISEDALMISKKNAVELNADIQFFQFDFLDENKWNDLSAFDIIVSNPPYIKESENETMRKNILDFEPHIALFVSDDDPLIFYKKIASFGKNHLANDGKIFVEINENLSSDVIELFKKEYYLVELRKDLQGKDRMIKATKINS